MPKDKGNRGRPPETPSAEKKTLPTPEKGLGQHFLTDTRLAERIVDALDPHLLATIPILEIGPGRMILTRILASRSPHLILLEKDTRLIPLLQASFEPSNRYGPIPSQVEILCDDALTAPFDLWEFPYLVISNLPYNISVPLLLKIMGGKNPPQQAVLMFQKEVGERITAPFGGKEYGSLSVAVSLLAHATPLFTVRPGSFSPPPKVHSIVLSLRPRADRGDPAFAGAALLARGAFGYRRKTLRNAFSLGLAPPISELAIQILDSESGLTGKRPEQIPSGIWVMLARRMLEHSPRIFDTITRIDKPRRND